MSSSRIPTLTVGFGFVAAMIAADVYAQPIEEVIVTARKREERLQDVPVSGTVFDAARLQDELINNAKDLIQRVPGAMMNEQGESYNTEIFIRGQGAGRTVNSEPASGLYRDGAYVAGGNLGGRTFSVMDFFDVQSVQIFRGPQGALFGRNAVGGAVSIITHQPVMEQEYSIAGEFGKNERYRLEAIANTPLIDDVLAVRGAILYEDQDDGFYQDVDGNALDTNEVTGGRLSARYERGDFDATLMLESYNQKAPEGSTGAFGVRGFNEDVAAFADPFDKPATFNTPARFERDETATNLTINWETGIGTWTAVGYYKQRDADAVTDTDFLDTVTVAGEVLPCACDNFQIATEEDELETWSLELRLADNDASDRIQWLVGADYRRLDDEYQSTSSGSIGQPVDLLLGRSLPGFAGAAALARFQNAIGEGSLRTSSDDESMSAFGLLGYDLTPKLNLTGELRVIRDDKDIRIRDDGLALAFTPAPTFVPNVFEREGSEDFTNVAWVTSLRWKPRDDATVYVRAAKASRPGGFNIAAPIPPTPDNPATPIDDSLPGFAAPFVFDEEDSRAIELGGKWDWRYDGGAVSLNVAYAHTDTKDVGVPSFCVSPAIAQTIFNDPDGGNPACAGNLVFFIFNQADTRTDTIEVDTVWAVERLAGIGGSLRAVLAGSWADGEYRNVDPFQGATNLPEAGNRPQFLPEYTVSASVDWRRPLAGDVALVAGISYRGQYDGFQTASNARPLSDVELTDVRLGLRAERWEVMGHVQNVFDEEYIRFVGANDTVNDPRSWTLRASYRF